MSDINAAGGRIAEKYHDNQDGSYSSTTFLTNPTLPQIEGAATSAQQTTAQTTQNEINTKLGFQATAVKQDTGNASLSSIDTKLTSQATSAKQDTAQNTLSAIDSKLASQSTAAKQDTGNSSLGSIDSKLNSQATAVNQTALSSAIGAPADASATTDTGTFSLISLIKRLLSKFTFDSLTGALNIQETKKPGYENNLKNRALIQCPGTPFSITTAGTHVLTGEFHINSIRVSGGVLGNVAIYDGPVTGTPFFNTTPDKGQVLASDVDVYTSLTIVNTNAMHILGVYGY